MGLHSRQRLSSYFAKNDSAIKVSGKGGVIGMHSSIHSIDDLHHSVVYTAFGQHHPILTQ